MHKPAEDRAGDVSSETGPRASMEWITPEIARSWLLHNTRNRAVNDKQVARFADDIEEGRWIVNGDAIRFGADDVLYDGQHRLLGIVRSGAAVLSAVVRGLDRNARDMIDLGGRKRNARDVLDITDGVKLSAAQVAWMTASEHLLARGSLSTEFAMTVSGLREATDRHGHASDVLAHVMSLVSGGRRFASAAVMGTLLIAWRSTPDHTEAFASVLKTGEAKDAASPAIAMRNFLIAQQGRSYGSTGREDISLRVFGALSAFIRGESQRITRPDAAARQEFLGQWSDPRSDTSPVSRGLTVASVREDVSVSLSRFVESASARMNDGLPHSVEDIAEQCEIPSAVVESIMPMVGARRLPTGLWTCGVVG